MTRQDRIKKSIYTRFQVYEFYLEDESYMHAGQRVESHFKLFLVSDDFKDISRANRQRLVQEVLKNEFETGMHALSLKVLSIEERKSVNPESFISPQCLGLNK